MRYPERSFLGYTWVGWLNIVLLQWFWLRLQGSIDNDRPTQWQIITPVAPLTGWRSNYWPKNRRVLHLTKREPLL